MATAVSQGATGNAYIDGVLSGVKWSGTVTYSFPDSATDYPGGYGSGEQFNDFAQISAQQQTAVHSIMQQIGNYTNLTITFAGTDGADIRMAHSDDANPTAYAYYPDNNSDGTGGDVWFATGYPNRWSGTTNTPPTSMRSDTLSASSTVMKPVARTTSPFRPIVTRSNTRL